MNTTAVTAAQPEPVTSNGVNFPEVAPSSETVPAPTTRPVTARFDQGAANSFAIASFVLGLVSVVAGWSFIAPIIGLILGITALKRGTGERTLALWGVWLNGVLLAIFAILGIAFLSLFGLAALASV